MSMMCLEDVGTLLLGPSCLMADPFGPLLDEDKESVLSDGASSPLSSSYSESSCSLSPLSPSLCASVGCKSELLSLSWAPESELLSIQTEPEQSKDGFSGMDWMTEKLDLGDFNLDSLIRSCDSHDPPSSPEGLLSCLDTDVDLDLNSLPFSSSELDLTLPPLALPLPELSSDPETKLETVEIKSEPLSSAPSPDSAVSSPQTLDLGSEIDVSEVVKSSTVLQSPEIMMSPSQIMVVLMPEEESSIGLICDQSGCDSRVSSSLAHRPASILSPKPAGSSRTKPYSKPDPDTSSTVIGQLKIVFGSSKIKKLKKMEQNKTAATRYRQKKRAEQESLNTECADLERRNRELAEKASSISREIQYLKNLMEEVWSVKNRKGQFSLRCQTRPEDICSSL